MDMPTSLFDGQLVRLGAINFDTDPQVEMLWSHHSEYLRMVDTTIARPLSLVQARKKLEAIEKSVVEEKNAFYFTVRACSDDRMVGFARLFWIEWTNGNGKLSLGIGDAADRGQGYGREALHLLLRYAFQELNLFRLSAVVPEYNLPAQNLLRSAGFVEEVRRRLALNRDGRRWDLLHYGLLREEGLALHAGEKELELR